jgi:hypothetical protein
LFTDDKRKPERRKRGSGDRNHFKQRGKTCEADRAGNHVLYKLGIMKKCICLLVALVVVSAGMVTAQTIVRSYNKEQHQAALLKKAEIMRDPIKFEITDNELIEYMNLVAMSLPGVQDESTKVSIVSSYDLIGAGMYIWSNGAYDLCEVMQPYFIRALRGAANYEIHSEFGSGTNGAMILYWALYSHKRFSIKYMEPMGVIAYSIFRDALLERNNTKWTAYIKASEDEDSKKVPTTMNKKIADNLQNQDNNTTSSTEKPYYIALTKAYFYDKPDESAKRSDYVNEGDSIHFLGEPKNGFGYVEYTQPESTTVKRGWMKTSDFSQPKTEK